ncbi:type II toxin-antitoxin system RelE/ParE family toxin [soil metagenome]
MLVRHTDKKLERLETDLQFRAGFGPDVVKAFRKRMALIRAAVDERAFYAMKSLHYEKLKGDRGHQRSMRLNDQFRLLVELEVILEKTIVIISIEDYH